MGTICSFDGCGKPVDSKGLCKAHYRQQKAGKELRPLQVQYHGFSEERRFMMRVRKGTKRDCWEWTGSTQNGWHGQWRNAEGKHELAHRASWRMFNGQITDGMFVLHKCDNPKCVNPDHLFLGTQSDNAIDMWRKGRARPKANIGEKHGMSKLTADKVREIRSSDEKAAVIAARLGVAPTTIYDVRKRKIWQHVP